ncbi:hypothetical protein [Dyadobacter sp. CY312]|uniref:hypothetical protein n=1 Tax=Dyadobacter sp. CY312 TaxID=2907303 RepID=UPI001F2917FE|nr:hypothetical protein [Dyadobacter sp. CY312]MCE7040915.1 hypothetical protein [Dyadobacter sp. CY312]
MLVIVLISSLLLIIAGKYGVKFLNFNPSAGKALTWIGQAGLGFLVGFAVYAHGADMLDGFWMGFNDARGKH